MENIFLVHENQSTDYYAINGRENAITFAKKLRKEGSAPMFVRTAKEYSWNPGVLFPDDFVYGTI